jgi:hypothetical protein
MIYLTETNVENGAFLAWQSNTCDVEQARRELLVCDQEMYLNNEDGAGAFSSLDDKAGDTIILDTNCPHSAVSLKPGHEGQVVRFDYLNLQWNAHWSILRSSLLKLQFSS